MEQTNDIIMTEQMIINAPAKKNKKILKTKTAPEPTPKTLEEMKAEREALDEAIRQAEMIDNIKTKAETYKQTIINTLTKKAEDKQRMVENLQAQINLLMDEGAQLVQEIDTLTETTGDELTLLLTEKYKEYVAGRDDEEKSDTTEKSNGKKIVRTAIDRKAYPAMLLDKMVFVANGNIKGTKNKVSLKVIFSSRDKCFYRYDKDNMTKYSTLQDANREWCNSRGYDKLGNAWEDFKAVKIDGKTRSIQTLHNDNWIANEGAEDYIDNNWNWN